MRIPKIEKFSDKISDIRVEKIDNIIMPEYHVKFLSDKDREKFIDQIKKVVRASVEYKMYIKYLQDYLDMTKCAFFNGVTNKQNTKIKIEIHHEPFTIFDIIEIVLNKVVDQGRDLNALEIADEVMKLHYQNKVGLIPLSQTVHELVHSGQKFIPLNHVFGSYIEFVQEYEDYIPAYTKGVLQTKIDMTKDCIDDSSILQKQFVYLEVDGFVLPDMSNFTNR
ncbi:MAG: hypothetical protein PHF63_00930 [Herbinix sp.]|nr:hypothetical protein [Herbinix sp.]